MPSNVSSDNQEPVRRTVGLTVDLPADLLDLAQAAFDVRMVKPTTSGAEALIEAAQGCDALLVGPSIKICADVSTKLSPSLKIVSSFTAGVDNIDLPAAQASGIAVTNTGSVTAGPTADIAMFLITATARNAITAFQTVKRGAWSKESPYMPRGFALNGAVLGILGMGNIGRAVARRAKAAGMGVIYHNRKELPENLSEGAEYCADPAVFFGRADIVSLHCPLTSATRHIINDTTLAQMKSGAILINTARGDLIDDAAVIAALQSEHLSGLGLDVYTGEPDINPFYRDSDLVVTLPHIGTATTGIRHDMRAKALENIKLFFAGNDVPDLLVQDPR